jgi:hypothetical protein
MKPYKIVNSDRKNKVKIIDKNTVHRSSLLVSEIPQSNVEISMLNHFLVKRNIKNVTCKITAIDSNGNILDNKSFELDKPQVYVFSLSKIFQNGNTYNVEFFSSYDLFVPFTAVIINYVGKNFISQVHAYNRILNDVFENDVVNKVKVDECCIDLNNFEETFFILCSGNNELDDEIKLKATTQGVVFTDSHKFSMKRFHSRKFDVSSMLNNIKINNWDGHLTISQPYQELFYGRLLIGQRYKDGAFSANHSYYDSSRTEEYWEGSKISYRLYPYLNGFENRVNIYPICSPSNLEYFIDLFNNEGSIIKSYSLGNLISPSDKFIKHLVNIEGVKENDIVSFGLKAITLDGKMPTRVTHQTVYGKGKIKCSINSSLHNENIFRNPKYGTFTWGEIILGNEYNTILSLSAGLLPSDFQSKYDVELSIFSINGLIIEKKFIINGGSCLNLDMNEFIDNSASNNSHNYYWYTAVSKLQGLTAYTISWNIKSNHCSGEHSF